MHSHPQPRESQPSFCLGKGQLVDVISRLLKFDQCEHVIEL